MVFAPTQYFFFCLNFKFFFSGFSEAFHIFFEKIAGGKLWIWKSAIDLEKRFATWGFCFVDTDTISYISQKNKLFGITKSYGRKRNGPLKIKNYWKKNWIIKSLPLSSSDFCIWQKKQENFWLFDVYYFCLLTFALQRWRY